jgi:hypothetical protein
VITLAPVDVQLDVASKNASTGEAPPNTAKGMASNMHTATHINTTNSDAFFRLSIANNFFDILV